MNTRRAARIRFGILSARRIYEYHRLTREQRNFLGCWDYGSRLQIGDRGTMRPFLHEFEQIQRRLP